MRLVTMFLAAVKASLVKLGVDESRLHRIVQEVSACNACMHTPYCTSRHRF